MQALVSLVQTRVPNISREAILNRAREAWPSSVDFKPVQVELLVQAMQQDKEGLRPMNRALHLGGVSRPQRVM